MKSKALIRNINLPDAPKPTKAFKSAEKPLITGWESALTAEGKERARTNGHRNNPRAWTDDEMTLIRRMIRAGNDLQEIADRLPRRTEVAVDAKIRKMRKKGEL